MLNPSIANETELDPTLRRVQGYAQDWGYDGMLIVNAFPTVSTDPKVLVPEDQTENDAHIQRAICGSELVMVGWGANMRRKELRGRRRELVSMLNEWGSGRTYAWKITNGEPFHPLYLPANIQRVRFA